MRINGLKKRLEKKRLDVFLITNLNNIYYFTGFKDIAGTELSLIVPIDDPPLLLTPPLSYVAAHEQAQNCIVEEVPGEKKLINRVIKEINDLKTKEVGFDDLKLPVYLKLTKNLKSIQFIQNENFVWELRRVKDNTEISFMKKAATLTDIGAKTGMEVVKAGLKEYEVAAEIEYSMRRKGSEGTAFETVVASGPRSAYPHGLSTNRIIKRGDVVVLDLGAVYFGYRCDITRTVVVGEPSSKQKKILEIILEAQKEAFNLIHAGVKAMDVDGVARKIIESHGFGRFFIHGLGHGVGLDIHEPPKLSSKSKDILEEGNVVTNEPGIYLQNFGARIEDTVLVHRNTYEKLTKTGLFKW